MDTDDIDVMPALVPLAVNDLQAFAKWYQDVLGFSTLFEVPGQRVHLRREGCQDLPLKPAGPRGERPSVRAREGLSA